MKDSKIRKVFDSLEFQDFIEGCISIIIIGGAFLIVRSIVLIILETILKNG